MHLKMFIFLVSQIMGRQPVFTGIAMKLKSAGGYYLREAGPSGKSTVRIVYGSKDKNDESSSWIIESEKPGVVECGSSVRLRNYASRYYLLQTMEESVLSTELTVGSVIKLKQSNWVIECSGRLFFGDKVHLVDKGLQSVVAVNEKAVHNKGSCGASCKFLGSPQVIAEEKAQSNYFTIENGVVFHSAQSIGL